MNAARLLASLRTAVGATSSRPAAPAMARLQHARAPAFANPSAALSLVPQPARHVALCARRPRQMHALPLVTACASPASPASPAASPAIRAAQLSTTARGTASGANADADADDEEAVCAPPVLEADLEESFVRGSGPGGQKINKTASCVVLKHGPTGLTVKCQQTRSQTKNRELARKLLQRRLDEMVRGARSDAAREESKARARKAKRRRKSVTKHFKSKRDRALLDI